MTLQGNLFIKVFVAFWLVTIAILGSWLLVTDYFESRPPRPGNVDRQSPGIPHRFMLRMIYNLENQNHATLTRSINKARNKHNIQIFLVTSNGKDLLAREVPDKVSRIANNLARGRQRAFIVSPRDHLSAYRIERPNDGVISAVFMFPDEPGLILNTLGDSLWLRIALAVLISGAICFALSRLMTNRLKDLQFASRRLANGELATRLVVRERGGDETDELARDFNSMAEQLQERIQAQKRLLRDVSHELRSPLARLRISLALAEEKPDDSQAYMQRIELETVRLEELINQLLSSQSQEVRLDLQVNLVVLLEQLCSDANFEGQGENKRFTFHSDTQQAVIASSSDLLRKSFENILRNALRNTAENSTVQVALASDEGDYLISIEDQGPGIPEQDLENVFEEFYQIDTARSPESGGFGLGLTIARRALGHHGGKISAHNTGSGLKIIVRLPTPPSP
jgi:signal transduction histidine kinase